MVGDIREWLECLGLGKYVEVFAENEIDLDVLPHLSEGDLNELGLPMGPRKKLLAAIAELGPSAPTLADPAMAAHEAERRQLTVMFVDLVGSTELSQRLDPEDLREVMRHYQDAVSGAVTRYKGYVAKFLGDGVLAYFGWPQAHEDQPERAVRAALDAITAVRDLSSDGGIRLQTRVGIATGQVVIGDLVGEAGRDADAVVGETPNLAARLQEVGAPGQVAIDEVTRHLIGETFDLVDLGARELKGFAAPLSVWRVVGERAVESRFEAAHAGHLTALVGREHEVNLLLDRWEQARGGEGQVVLLAGEAGIGKSRITQALRERISEEAHTDLRYQCSPHYQSTALHPFIAQLERAAGLAESDDEETRLGKLEALLRTTADDITDTMPLLAALLSIATGSRYPALELGPQQQMQRTQEALLDHLTALATRQPVFVLFEDTHWADPTTMVVLEQLVDRLQELSALAVMTYRPEFQPPWAGRTHITTLTLNRLNRRQATAMVEDLAGGKAFPEEVLGQIVDKTDGVPLFVEELTKMILESDLLEERADRYLLSGPLPSLAIPNTLRDSLIARLDHLAPIKKVAQTAAVIGREFSHKLLAALSPLSEGGLEDALDRLIDAKLVFRRGSPPDAEYVFKHALVCDAAYETLLKSTRRALHTRICTVLEEHFPHVVEVEPELIAYHATRADNHALAIDYWLRAGKRAASQSANTEAVSHLRNGLKLLPRLPEGDERDRIELSYFISLGPALMATVGWDAEEVDETYSLARKLATRTNQPGVLFPSVWGLWLVAHAGGAAEQARELLKELIDLAQAGDDEALLLQAHHAGGSNNCSDGLLHEAQRHIAEGVTLYRRGDYSDQALRYGGHDPCVCAQSLGALTQLMLGHLDAAERYSQDAMKLAETVEHRPSVAHAYLYRAELCFLRGESRETGERARTVLEIAEPFGLAHYAAWARIHTGWSCARQGDVDAGLELVERGIRDLREVGIRYHLGHRLALWVETLIAKGDNEGAASAAQECHRAVEETGERWFEPEALRLLAHAKSLLGAGDAEEVEGLLRQSLDVADELDARYWRLRTANALARLWRDQGRTAEARDLLIAVYGWFTEGFDTQDLKDAKTLLDELS